MKFLPTILLLAISLQCLGQSFPYGKYYFYPEPQSSYPDSFKVWQTAIYADSIVSRRVDGHLNAVPYDLHSSRLIDTIIQSGADYYFVYQSNFIKEENRSSRTNHYRFEHYRVVDHAGNPEVYTAVNHLDHGYTDMYSLLHFLKSDTVTKILSRAFFSKAEYLEIAAYKSVDQITREDLIDVLQKARAESDSYRSFRRNHVDGEIKTYYRNPLGSYLVKAKYNFMFRHWQWSTMLKKFEADEEIQQLFRSL